MNHYERLGVSRGVSADELRRAYRELARVHHPDRNPDAPEDATSRMVAINEAFDVLSDAVRKFDYDRSLDRSAASARASETPQERRPKREPAGRAEPLRPKPTTEDDAVRRARREAKEREAAEAKRRGYRAPGGGAAGKMNFRAPK